MEKDFTERGMAMAFITGYIDKAVEYLSRDFTTSMVSDAEEHMFKINRST